jgi:hypothetical protein
MLSLVLFLSLFLTLMTPASAQTEDLKVTTMVYTNPAGQLVEVPEGSVIARSVTDLTVMFNHQMDAPDTYANLVHITDSHGGPAPFAVGHVFPDALNTIPLVTTGPLAKNETYTITLTGGPNGIKTGMSTLPADVKLTFKTDAASFRKTVRTGYNPKPGKFGIGPEIRTYAINAGAGELRILVKDIHLGTNVRVSIYDDESESAVYQEDFFSTLGESTDVTHSATLPHDGWYYVMLNLQNHTDDQKGSPMDAEFTGNDILLPSAAMPSIYLTTGWNTSYNAPFQVQAVNEDTDTKLKSAMLYLDGKPYKTFPINADNTLGAVTVDVSGLSDGIHWIAAGVAPSNSNNEAGDRVPVLIDRADTYTDVPKNAWFRRQIELLSHEGVLSGVGNGRFEPDRAVTREEFAKMMGVTLNVTTASGEGNPFVDVPSAGWATPWIAELANRGLISGETRNGQRYFRPGDTISRAEAVSIIGRQQGITAEYAGEYVPPLSDFASVPDWAKPHVAVLQYAGWVNGSNGKFNPNNTLTRAEAATLLSKYWGL